MTMLGEKQDQNRLLEGHKGKAEGHEGKRTEGNLGEMGYRAGGNPDNSPLEQGLMEIEKKSQLFVAASQVGEELGSVHGKEALHGLEFDNDEIFDQQVEA